MILLLLLSPCFLKLTHAHRNDNKIVQNIANKIQLGKNPMLVGVELDGFDQVWLLNDIILYIFI